ILPGRLPCGLTTALRVVVGSGQALDDTQHGHFVAPWRQRIARAAALPLQFPAPIERALELPQAQQGGPALAGRAARSLVQADELIEQPVPGGLSLRRQ